MVDPDDSEPVCSLADAWTIGADPYLETYVDHPEGVAVGGDGTLYAGGEDGQIYRINPENNAVSEIATTGGFTLCLTFDVEEEHLYVCDFQKHAIFRLPMANDGTTNGDLETVTQGTKEEYPIQPNYCVFDSDGRLYYSDSGDRTAPMDRSEGRLCVVEPDGTERVLTDELDAWTNGLALSRDEERLYVAETGTERVSVVYLEDGEATGIDLVADGFGHVDGLQLDAEDNLYVASIGDDAIYRYRDGEPEVLLYDPVGLTMCNPTNLAFGGENMRTMYVANLGLQHVTAVVIDRKGRYPTARL